MRRAHDGNRSDTGKSLKMVLIAATLTLAGCAADPAPVVRSSGTFTPGARTIALAPPAPETAAGWLDDPRALADALARSGYRLVPVGARYLLVVTVGEAPPGAGAYGPADGTPPWPRARWTVPPGRRALAGLGHSGPFLRVTAIVFEAASGRELWRASLATRRHGGKPTVASMVARLLAELPNGQGAPAA